MAKELVKKKVGRPPADLEKYFTKIQPYLMIGYTLHKACLHGEVPYSTLIPYYNENEDFRNRIERTRTLPNVQARQNMVNAIAAGDVKVSQTWLEAMEKDEFSKMQEVKDVTPVDEGVILLREIIVARRLKMRKTKELKAKNEENRKPL